MNLFQLQATKTQLTYIIEKEILTHILKDSSAERCTQGQTMSLKLSYFTLSPLLPSLLLA